MLTDSQKALMEQIKLQASRVDNSGNHLIPCHVCGTLMMKEEVDENAAYTSPDNKPYCPEHSPGT